MSAIRTIAVVAVLLAVAASAASTFQAGCGMKPAASLFGNSSLKCTKGNDCLKTFCACINATVAANFTCGPSMMKPNCSVATTCIAARASCINKAADDDSCANLKNLKMSNLAVAGGALYNESAAYKSCKYDACMGLNSTAGNCTLDFRTLCASPVVFIGTLKLKGDFTKILNDPVQKAAFKAALATDLAKALGVAYVVITRIYVSAKSRRQATQTLIIEFAVPGVSVQNTNFSKALESVKTGSGAWLVAALAAYKEVYGADAVFTFAGISAGSASSATFSTSAASSSNNGNTGASSASSSASASGAASQSVMAAVVVAVIGAMLF